MSYESIKLDIESGFATLTFTRPDKKTAFNPTMRD